MPSDSMLPQPQYPPLNHHHHPYHHHHHGPIAAVLRESDDEYDNDDETRSDNAAANRVVVDLQDDDIIQHGDIIDLQQDRPGDSREKAIVPDNDGTLSDAAIDELFDGLSVSDSEPPQEESGTIVRRPASQQCWFTQRPAFPRYWMVPRCLGCRAYEYIWASD